MRSTFFFSLLLFASLTPVRAGTQLSPEGIVRAAILAASSDDRSDIARFCDFAAIASKPRHGMREESVIELLKLLSKEGVQFDPPPTIEESVIVTVRMTTPRRLDFDLVASKESNGASWRIVAIHP